MKRGTLLLCSLCTAAGLNAQEVMSTQGESYSTANGNIDFTIGEVIISTGTNGTNTLTQGFHQTNWNFVGLEDHSPGYQVSIFPNPSSDVLNIQAEMFENVSYRLYDAQGKLVLQDLLSAELTPIRVIDLPVGSYSLTLTSEREILKTFKLIKH